MPRIRVFDRHGNEQFVATLRRLEQLVRDGLTVVGSAPEASPSLGDDPQEWRRIVAGLWPAGDEARVGAGRVFAQASVEAALAAIGVSPDFDYVALQPDSEVLFTHRQLNDGEVFFLNNRRNRADRITARFRVAGKVPEIWRADAGTVQLVSYRISGNITEVPLDFAPEESFFVVFRKPTTAVTATVTTPVLRSIAELSGGWSISFQPRRGAPQSTSMSSLTPLNENNDPGIRYFSGVATYRTQFELPRGHRTGEPLFLDLGNVGDVAEVLIDGRSAGTLWHAPWRMDIGRLITRGTIKLEIRVAICG